MNRWYVILGLAILLASSVTMGQGLPCDTQSNLAAIPVTGISRGIERPVPLSATTMIVGQAVAPAPLIQNGGFEDGFAPWHFYTNGEGWYTDDPPGEFSGHACHLIVTGQGTNVQLYQSGIPLKSSTQYRLRFSARSNSGHDMMVTVLQHAPPYMHLGLIEYLCDIGTTWCSFDAEFTTPEFVDSPIDARLRFWLAPFAEEGDEYAIDNVILEEVVTPGLPLIVRHPADVVAGIGERVTFRADVAGEGVIQWQMNDSYLQCAIGPTFTTQPLTLADTATTFRFVVKTQKGFVWSRRIGMSMVDQPMAIITNPGFELGDSGWNFYTNGQADFSVVGNPAVARIHVEKEGSNTQLYASRLSFTSERQYRLSFKAMCPASRICAVQLIKHTAPYTNYGLEYTEFELSPEWKTYTKEFVATRFSGNAADGRLMIWLGSYAQAGDEYFFDDVVVEEVSPGLAPLGREVAIAENLEGTTHQSNGPMEFRLEQNYPNPFNPSTVIRFSLPWASHVHLTVFDMLGREMATLVDGVEGSGYKSVIFSANGLAAGLYLYRIEARPIEGAEPFISIGRMLLLK